MEAAKKRCMYSRYCKKTGFITSRWFAAWSVGFRCVSDLTYTQIYCSFSCILQTLRFFVLCFLVKFGLTVCTYLTCFGVLLHSFCLELNHHDEDLCHPAALLKCVCDVIVPQTHIKLKKHLLNC